MPNPERLCQFSDFARNLHANFLEGDIPAELQTLTSLQRLWLWGNSLKGTIPTELGLLSSARFIYLDKNALTGPLPSEFGMLSIVEGIELFKNARSLAPENFTLATDAAMAQQGTQPFEAKAALAAWNDALAIAPSPVEAEGVRIHLARIHAHLGQADAARALLAKVRGANAPVYVDPFAYT